MTRRNMLFAGLFASVALMVLAAGCDKGTEPTPPKKPLELLYPTGGESFMMDSVVTIRWRINDTTQVSSVVVKLSINNGLTYDYLISSTGSVFPPELSVPWIVTSDQASSQCKIWIYEYQPGHPEVSDKSAVFTVTKKPLELLYPTGGESFKVDSVVTIRWRINDTTQVSSVVVKLSTNNGLTYSYLISSAGSIFPPELSIPWTITSDQVSTQCKIWIYEYQPGHPEVSDKSAVFTVTN
jgi:hypothetical protein